MGVGRSGRAVLILLGYLPIVIYLCHVRALSVSVYLLFIHSYLILWSVSRFGTPRGFPRAEQEVDPSWHIEVRFPQGFLSVFSVFLVLVKWWFI